MAAFDEIPLHLDPLPAFEQRILFEDDNEIIQTEGMGTTVRRLKSSPNLYYGFLDHPVKSADDWERYKERLLASTPGRIPGDIEVYAKKLNASSNPVLLNIFPFFFRLGFYTMGMERFMTAFYDMPELIHDMFSFWSKYVLDVIDPLLKHIDIDCVSLNEDLAYKSGTHISPEVYKEFWIPHQAPVISALKGAGIDTICLWTAGNIKNLLPLFMNAGINCTWPLERIAGMDPIELQREYGNSLRLAGGFPKEALIEGPEAIDRALEALMPAIQAGGYIPALDDMVPVEVPLENYVYFINALRAVRF